MSSNIKNDENIRELENLRIIMDIFEKREMRIKTIISKQFDPKAIIVFIITALPSVVTLIKEISELINI
ncbi:MAG TPA: hypothetical protein HA261_08380 [Methanosarcina sp.]|nr:hypothetical protein [Methanosarcina sp.]